MKILVISQPKSGTYLCANLLQEFELTFTGLHINTNCYHEYDLSDLKDSVENSEKYRVVMDLPLSLSKIKENSFAVSHLNYNHEHQKLLNEFKKVLVTRNYYQSLESYERFKELRKVPHYSKIVKLKEQTYQDMKKWRDVPNTFHITFDDMINKNIKEIDKLQEFLFNKIIYNSETTIVNALNKDSLTKSSIRK